MSNKLRLASLLVISCVIAILACSADPQPAKKDKEPTAKPTYGFPDFGYLPSPEDVEGHGGQVFKLSQQYPTAKPGKDKLPPFLNTNFKQDWRKYAAEVRAYCLEGNIDDDVDFRVEKSRPHLRRWFHAPWQHYGPAGREGLRGLTREVKIKSRQLAPTQTTDSYQVYAIGFYNEFGGHTLGQVWRNPEDPDLRATDARYGGGFPIGTVIFKLLFTDASVAEVPHLVNPIEWDAFVTQNYESEKRVVRRLRLIQMDFMIREDLSRAPRGWVFGTFVYNGKLEKASKWDNLVPVGLQWGDDPTVTKGDIIQEAVKTQINPAIKESKINDDGKELPPTHLGWGGRLNGPVDNPASSCMSCHGTAQVPALSPQSPKFLPANQPQVGSKEWMRWFENRKCGEPFDKKARSTDFCLQIQMGVQSFWEWKNSQMKGYYFFQSPHTRNFKASRSEP
jgi:hypothetical protein